MQKKVKDFNDKMNCHKEPMPTYARLMDIQSEMGELVKEYLKGSKYGTLPFTMHSDFELEFGDTLYSMLCLANETGIDAEKSLDRVLTKYKKRIEENGTMGSKKE